MRPKEILVPTAFDIEDFYSRAVRVGECLEWSMSLNGRGYGQVFIAGRKYLSHRVSYLLSRGFIDSTLLVCHACDNRRCINPEHLFQGSYMDNHRDMTSKGRGVYRRSEASKKISMKGMSNPYRISRINKNPYVGAYRNRSKWRAIARVDGKPRHIGSFETQLEAHQAYIKFINGIAP